MTTEIPHGISVRSCDSCPGFGPIYHMADGRRLCEGCIAVLAVQFHASSDEAVNEELREVIETDRRLIEMHRWMQATQREMVDTIHIERLIEDRLRQLGTS